MATTVLDNTYFSTKFIHETDLQKEALQNLTNGPATVTSVSVLNGGNPEILYLKLYDAVAIASGTQTQADYVFRMNASADTTFHFPDGLTFENGLTARLVTTAALSGNTDPSSAVTVEIAYT